MTYLSALVTPARTLFGADQAGVLAITVMDVSNLPAATTPTSFFVILKQGGFILWNDATADQLGKRGFTVMQHDLIPAEVGWLAAQSPSWVNAGRPMTVYFATCPMGATLDADGQPACGQALPAGAREVPARPGSDPCSVASLPEVAQGEVSAGQLDAVKRIAPAGATVCYRYFGGNPVVTDADKVAARETIRIYDRLTRSVDQLENHRRVSGGTFTPAQVTAIASARTWLASNSQMVEKARPVLLPSGSGNRPLRPHLRPPPPPRPPLKPLRRAQRFGAVQVVIAIVVIAAVAISIAYAVVGLANAENQKAGIAAQLEMNRAVMPMIQDAVKVLNDPNSTPAQKQAARQTLAALNEYVKEGSGPFDPGDEKNPVPWGDVAKYGAIGVGILATVWLVGPAIHAASSSAAAGFDVSRQKKEGRARMVRELTS